MFQNNHNIEQNPTHYEYAFLSQQVYQPNGGLPPGGWQILSHRYHDNELGFAAATYINHERRCAVIVFRGTENRWNWVATNFLLPFAQLPSTSGFAELYTRATMQEIPNDYHISTTGHSLGAALAEIIACRFRLPAVTFESPGTRHIVEADPQHLQRPEEANITTYLTAPNAINTLNPQIGRCYRLYLPHTDGSISGWAWHTTSCVIGSAARLSLFAIPATEVAAAYYTGAATVATAEATTAAATATAAALATSTVQQAYQVAALVTEALVSGPNSAATRAAMNRIIESSVARAARTDPVVAANIAAAAAASAAAAANMAATATASAAAATTVAQSVMIVRIGEQIIGTVEWCMRQHSIDPIVNQFDPVSGQVRRSSRILNWPNTSVANRQGLSAAASAIARSMVPFSATNRGLHNIHNEEGVMEARIAGLPGYSVEAPVLLGQNNG